MQLNRKSSRGDTLIEVLFAISVFSMVVVSSIAIMNKGMDAAQRTLGITVTRQLIDTQAQILRTAHDSYIAQYPASTYTGLAATYNTIESSTYSSANPGSDFIGSTTCPANVKRGSTSSFVLSPSNPTQLIAVVTNNDPTAYPLITSSPTISVQGIWVEAIRKDANSTDTPIGYIDFHINACWPGPGSNVPLTLGTIVRLYEPKAS